MPKPSQKNRSANSDEWLTPPSIVECLHALGPVVLDPCGHPASIVGAALSIDAIDGLDGLAFDWDCEGLVFVNPPYSDLGSWLDKCAIESKRIGIEIVVLCPPRVDTKAFHKSVFGVATAIAFPVGRIAFVHPSGAIRGGNDTPSCLIYYGARPAAFARAFGVLGAVLPAR